MDFQLAMKSSEHLLEVNTRGVICLCALIALAVSMYLQRLAPRNIHRLFLQPVPKLQILPIRQIGELNINFMLHVSLTG